MDFNVLIGFSAGILTTFALLPQLIKAVRTKSADDISEGWMAADGMGVALWTYYGYVIGSMPLILFNTLSLVFLAALYALKLRYNRLTVK